MRSSSSATALSTRCTRTPIRSPSHLHQTRRSASPNETRGRGRRLLPLLSLLPPLLVLLHPRRSCVRLRTSFDPSLLISLADRHPRLVAAPGRMSPAASFSTSGPISLSHPEWAPPLVRGLLLATLRPCRPAVVVACRRSGHQHGDSTDLRRRTSSFSARSRRTSRAKTIARPSPPCRHRLPGRPGACLENRQEGRRFLCRIRRAAGFLLCRSSEV